MTAQVITGIIKKNCFYGEEMTNFNKSIQRVCCVFSGILFCIIIGMIAYLQLQSGKSSVTDFAVDLSASWVDEAGNAFTLNNFTYNSANEQNPKRIYYTLDSVPQDFLLMYYCRNMYSNIYINDQLTCKDQPLTDFLCGSSPGVRWHMAVIPVSDTPVTICLENVDVYTNTNGLMDDIYIGTSEQVFRAIIGKHFVASALSFLIILFGVILCGFFIYFIRKYHIGAEFVYLGAATFYAGIWSACESYLLPLFFGNSEFFHLISYLCLVAMPPSFGLIAMHKLSGKTKTVSSIYVLVSCINAAVTCFLHFSRIQEFHYTLGFTHLLLFAFIPVSFLLLQSYHFKGKHVNIDVLHIIGICIIAFSLFTALVHYYKGTSNDFSFYFRLCVIGFLLCMILYQMILLVQMIKNGTRADTLHSLAITDMLTQLYNRTAFQEHKKNYISSSTGCSKVGIVQFDINNLKTINDTMGHEKGDQLIKLAAQGILSSFEKYGNCYRMGGDEFLVVLTGKQPDLDYEKGIEYLETFCKKNTLMEEQEKPIYVEIAHGFAFDYSLSLDEAIQSADKEMYKNKKILKEKNQGIL